MGVWKGKLPSLFEPSTEVIRKGKAGQPNEFGKMVKLQEAENQIITDYEVYARRPHDSELLVAAIESIKLCWDAHRVWVAADAAFYSTRNEAAAKAKGIKRICIPNRATKSLERQREQRSAGSATARSGAPDVKDAAAWSSGGTVSTVAATRDLSE
jgi:IS5 family transposase